MSLKLQPIRRSLLKPDRNQNHFIEIEQKRHKHHEAAADLHHERRIFQNPFRGADEKRQNEKRNREADRISRRQLKPRPWLRRRKQQDRRQYRTYARRPAGCKTHADYQRAEKAGRLRLNLQLALAHQPLRLEDAEQEDKVKRELDKLRYKRVNPEDITFIDPCCGSGHILVYAFDVFYDMYLERGYGHQEIAKLILEKNLFGLDLDDRAVRLASFALMMKAREKNRSMFGQASKLHVCTIQQSNWLKAEWMNEFAGKQEPDEQGKLREMLTSLRDTFEDAKEYGSILKVKPLDLSVLESAMEKLANELEDQGDIPERIAEAEMLEKMPALLRQYKMLAATYDVVCTNPPYMGGSGMGAKLSEHVKNNYPDSRADLFAVFIESCGHMVKNHGFQAMITQHAWMFLSRYKKLRGKLIQRKLVNMLHLGAKAFEEIGGEVVQTTAFVLRKGNVPHFNSTFVRLVEYDQAKLKEEKFLQGKDRYITQTENFAKIPGVPFAYWSSSTGRDIFANNPLLKDLAVTRKGMATGLNAEFVRSWYEVEFDTIGFSFDRSTAKHSNRKWFPYANGGEFKKWYGNYTDVVNWENDGYRLQTEQHESGRIRAVNRNLDYIFTEGLCWTSITSSNFSTRLLPKGFLFSSASNALFSEENAWYYLGLLNSKVFSYLSRIINSTLNANPGDISKIPVKFNDRISRERVNALVEIAKEDWNSSEVSWDFTEHPFLKYRDGATEIRQAFQNWCTWAEHRFNQLRAAEAELNTLFIETYGLQKELSAEVDETDVTISRAEQNKDMKSFISYAIGCMFGRYSLDQERLICAGGLFDPQAYRTFKTNEDNIVPITTNAYFDNEIVLRFVEFVEVTFGEKALAENLEFIAESLGKKNRETSMETIGRYLINDFFKDHVQMYKKKPIYWLFTSGKQKAFHCLVYIHRYDRSTLSKIRTDYVQKLQALLEVEKRLLLRIIEEGGPAPKISNAKKELNIVVLKIDELQNYEERLHYMADLHIELDLDDGVSRNYAIFTDLLAKID